MHRLGNMHIVAAVLVGAILGALTHLLMPGRNPGGVMATVMCGIVGAVASGLLGRLLGWSGPGLTLGGIVSAFLGAAVALLFLLAYRVMVARRTT
jgi:uncharacterized membrane protein YeaQ/YmgE (transglycosylase-associated protein family)